MTQPVNKPAPVTAGDIGISRTMTIGGYTDLTTVTTVTPKVRLADGDAWTSLSGSVLSAVANTVTINYGSWLAALTTGGDWQMIIVLAGSGFSETVPPSPMTLNVLG